MFRQEKDGDPMRHAGNVRAPDADLAMHYAREFYSRRQESVRLWVVPRSAIRDLSDPDLLQPPLDRSFKKPGGYVMRDKLRRRATAGRHGRGAKVVTEASAASAVPRGRRSRRTCRASCNGRSPTTCGAPSPSCS